VHSNDSLRCADDQSVLAQLLAVVLL